MFGRKRRLHERSIDEYAFSQALQDRFASEHPDVGIRDQATVFEGLRHWFHVCRLARESFVAMPSQAVDDAWHEFILFTREYDRFCHGAFGRFLHHTPTAGLGVANPDEVMRDGHVRTWHHACAVDGVDPYTPDRLPLLFAVDEQIAYPGGFRYDLSEIVAERASMRRLRQQVPVGEAAVVAAAHPWWPGSHTGQGCTGGTTVVTAPGSGFAGGDCGGGGCGGGCGGG